MESQKLIVNRVLQRRGRIEGERKREIEKVKESLRERERERKRESQTHQ